MLYILIFKNKNIIKHLEDYLISEMKTSFSMWEQGDEEKRESHTANKKLKTFVLAKTAVVYNKVEDEWWPQIKNHLLYLGQVLMPCHAFAVFMTCECLIM